VVDDFPSAEPKSVSLFCVLVVSVWQEKCLKHVNAFKRVFILEKQVLVTGGAGYIGSHTVVALLEAGYRVIVLDNFCNSSPKSIDRIRQILRLEKTDPQLRLVEADIRCEQALDTVFEAQRIDSVPRWSLRQVHTVR
jgi:FlaA1/EpsC-like NDP-sugar epimerase